MHNSHSEKRRRTLDSYPLGFFRGFLWGTLIPYVIQFAATVIVFKSAATTMNLLQLQIFTLQQLTYIEFAATFFLNLQHVPCGSL